MTAEAEKLPGLKPCPFCGGRAALQPVCTTPGAYGVECQDCGACSILANAQTAVARWNRRADHD